MSNETDVTLGKPEDYTFEVMWGALTGDLMKARLVHWQALVAIETELLRIGTIHQRERFALKRPEREAYWKQTTG